MGARRMFLIGIVLSFLTISAPGAEAEDPMSCGQVVSSDVVLTSDLLDCPGFGLVVGADDVTIDLNGYMIDGVSEGEYVGILNDGYDGLTVRNGTIRQFVEGVLVIDAADLRVARLATTEMAHVSVYLDTVSGARVASGRSLNDCGGVVVDNSTDVAVVQNVMIDQTCAAVAVYHSTRVVVRGNSVRSNRPAEAITHDAAGIGVYAESDDVIVEGNQVADSGFVGIIIDGANHNIVRGNVAAHNNIGIIVMGNRNIVHDNWVSDTGQCPDPSCGLGISLEGGRANVIADNTVMRTSTAGIRVTNIPNFTPAAVDTSVRGNEVDHSGGDGILVLRTSARTAVVGNKVLGSRDDGVDVNSRRARLSHNYAAHNRDLGIEASRGVRDGGRNRGRLNGDRRQCTGIVC